MKKEIKEVWFKDHKANYIKINENLKILEWKKPNTLHMNVRYVMDKHNLYVTGDLYSAMFSLTEQANLESLGQYDLYYFSRKLTTIEQSQSDFDSQSAIKELKERFNDWWDIDLDTDVEEEYIEHKEVLEMLICEAEECSSEQDWIDSMKLKYDEISDIDPDCSEWIFNVGMETSAYLQAYLIGLQMAYEQIFKDK